MSGKEKNIDQLLLKNIELNNGFILNELNLSNNISLYYAANGTSKSTIYDYLISDYNFESYEIFSHSYLLQIKNFKNENLEKIIDDINLINSDNFDLKKRDLEKIKKIKNSFPTLLNNEYLLSGYSEYKENFFNKFSEISSFEQFFEDFFKIQDFFKKDNNVLKNFLKKFSSISQDFDFSKIEINKFHTLLRSIKSSKKNFLNWKESTKKYLDSIDSKMKTSFEMEKDKELQEDDKVHFLNQMKRVKVNFENKQIQENNKLKKEIISFFPMIINQPIIIHNNSFVRKQSVDWVELIANVIKSNGILTKTFSNIIQYEIFEWIVNNIFILYILFSLFKVNENIVDELNKFNEISKDLKSILKVIRVKSNSSQRKEIEIKFNSFFFDYIKFSNIKIIDYLLFDKKIKINIFVNGKIISNFDNMSDGELNALFLISMYIKMSLSSSLKKIVIMDDSSIAFDKTNWLGLLNLLSDFVNENNKLIIFSHDYSFINIAQKFLSRKALANHQISIASYQLIRKNNFIFMYDFEYYKDSKLNYSENFLVRYFLNLSINGERNKDIENLLHYYPTNKASDLVNNLDSSCLEKEKKELLKFIMDNNIGSVIDFFEKLINCKNCSKLSKKIYKFFLIRLKIEKICIENSDLIFFKDNNKKSTGTLNIIKNSKFNKENQNELISIYNNLPSYIHLNFYDISYVFDLNIDFVDSLLERVEIFEKKLAKESNN